MKMNIAFWQDMQIQYIRAEDTKSLENLGDIWRYTSFEALVTPQSCWLISHLHLYLDCIQFTVIQFLVAHLRALLLNWGCSVWEKSVVIRFSNTQGTYYVPVLCTAWKLQKTAIMLHMHFGSPFQDWAVLETKVIRTLFSPEDII